MRFLLIALALSGAARAGPAPEPPRPPLLPADEAVAIALRDNPALQAARAGLGAALLGAERARPAFRPEVTATASQVLRAPRVDLPGKPDDVVLPNSISRLEIGVRQPVFQFGAGRAPASRARGLAAAARCEFRKEQLDLALQVREAHLEVARAEALADVAHSGLELARANVERTRLLIQAGQQAEVDLLDARRAEAEAEAAHLHAAGGVALARAALNRLLGRDLDTPFALPPAGELPVPPGRDAMRSLAAEAALRRPEAEALRHNIEAAGAGIRLARAARQPRVSLEAVYALQTETVLVPRSGIAAGVSITAPLFDGAVHRLTVREAEQRLEQLKRSLQALEQGMALEIERERLAMEEARARGEAAARALAAAQKAFEITLLRLERGQGTQLELQGARLSRQRALSDRVGAETDRRLAGVRMERALGRGLPER